MIPGVEKWSYHKKAIRENEHLSSSDKEKVLMGLAQVERIFGEDFLEIAIQKRHPILKYFFNNAPWTRFWLAEFGVMLSELEGCDGFERIHERLISEQNFPTALSELEIAFKFKNADFLVEFYPKHGRYECDLKVKKQNEEIYIEIANIGPSEEERKTWHTFHELSGTYIFDHEVEVAGKVYKSLSSPRIAEIRRKISSCAKEAKKTKRCIVISQPGIVEIIICPRSLSDEVSKWLKQKGLSSHFEGPSYQVDELRRVVKAFRDENRQLPKDKPGIVVLYHSRIFVKSNADSYRRLVYELEEEIYEHSNLTAGVLVFPDVVGASEAGSYGGDFAWSRKTKSQLKGENTVVIKNKYSKFQISEDAILALITSRVSFS